MREAHQQHGWLSAFALAIVLGVVPVARARRRRRRNPRRRKHRAGRTGAGPTAGGAALKGDEALDKMASFKDEMCTCKDSSCAQRVADEMTKWAQDQVRDSEPPKLTDEQTQRATKLGEAMGTCMQTAMGASPQPSP